MSNHQSNKVTDRGGTKFVHKSTMHWSLTCDFLASSVKIQVTPKGNNHVIKVTSRLLPCRFRQSQYVSVTGTNYYYSTVGYSKLLSGAQWEGGWEVSTAISCYKSGLLYSHQDTTNYIVHNVREIRRKKEIRGREGEEWYKGHIKGKRSMIFTTIHRTQSL